MLARQAWFLRLHVILEYKKAGLEYHTATIHVHQNSVGSRCFEALNKIVESAVFNMQNLPLLLVDCPRLLLYLIRLDPG